MIRKLAGAAGMLCCCALLAGCGGSSPSAAPSSGGTASPAWAPALGAGITVIPPAPAAPGRSSPAAVAQGVVNAGVAGQLSSVCSYVEPSFQAQCNQDASGALGSDAVSYENFAIGYVVIHGTEALVGTTGTECDADLTPVCMTNTNPAAIFDTGQSFQTLWTEANAGSPSDDTNSYSLLPCIQINGQWYLDTQSFQGF